LKISILGKECDVISWQLDCHECSVRSVNKIDLPRLPRAVLTVLYDVSTLCYKKVYHPIYNMTLTVVVASLLSLTE